MTNSGGVVVGPGSQPAEADGLELDYMEMPEGMSVFSTPELPEPEEAEGLQEALTRLTEVKEGLESCRIESPAQSFDLMDLDQKNREFVDQMLGEGEVSIIAGACIQAQESVLAGVWRVHVADENGAVEGDRIEIGAFPQAAMDIAFQNAQDLPPENPETVPDGVMNAPALLSELRDKAKLYQPGVDAHVVNLTLLPLSEEDLSYLSEQVGQGQVTILSRGYGNCRITSTNTKNLWWVQYYNSRDALILNTLEVTDVPDVACAAQEDVDDSAQRLGEILGVYK